MFDFRPWDEIIRTLEISGFAEDSEISVAIEMCKDGNGSFLQELLDQNKDLLWGAEAAIAEEQKRMEQDPFHPHPCGEELEALDGVYPVGYVNSNFDTLSFSPEDFTKILLNIGHPGTGKTYFSFLLADQILSVPPWERDFNVIFVQRLKREADGFILKYPDWFRVVNWPDDISYNFFEKYEWQTPDQRIESSVSIFNTENYLMTLTQPIFKKVVKQCFYDNGVFDGSNNYPTFSQINQKLRLARRDLGLSGGDSRNQIDKLIIRTSEFAELGDTLNCKWGFPFNFWTDNDMCINVDNESSEYLIRTVVMNIFNDLKDYHSIHNKNGSPLRTLIILDESRWIFGDKKNDMFDSNRNIERLLTTAREAGLGFVITIQEVERLASFVLSNASFIMAFPTFGESYEKTVKLLNLTPEQSRHMFTLPSQGTAVFRGINFPRPLIVDIASNLDFNKSVPDEQVAQIMRPVFKGIHDEIDSREEITGDFTKSLSAIPIQYKNILKTLVQAPFTHFTQLRKTSNLKDSEFNTAMKWLDNNHLVVGIDCRVSAGTKKARFYPLTERTHRLLETPQSKIIGTKLFKHTFYCRAVAEHLRRQGSGPILEYPVPGGEGRIDVYTKHDNVQEAYEITLTADNLLSNVEKCLYVMKVARLHIVCEYKKGRAGSDAAKRKIAVHLSDEYLEKVTFTTMATFFRK